MTPWPEVARRRRERAATKIKDEKAMAKGKSMHKSAMVGKKHGSAMKGGAPQPSPHLLTERAG